MKKWISALCIAAGLVLCAPVFTLGPAGRTSAAEAEGGLTAAATGWQQDSKGTFYLENGTKATGWRTIDGKRYYFKANGYRVYKTYKIDNVTYLFRPETDTESPGALLEGYSGLIQFSNEDNLLYYLNDSKDGVLTVSKWVKSGAGYYYANAKGQIKLGTIRLKNKLYHITRDNGRMTFYGKSLQDGKFYYAGTNGVLKTGFQTINKKLYYFSPATGERAYGTVKIDGSTYYFSHAGYATTGWVKKSGGSKIYYHDSSGKRVTGWYTIKNKKYYFDPAKGGTRVQNCWKKIDGVKYRFGSTGILQTGFFKVDGKTYYANADGVRQTGWQTVNGRKYYMSPTSYVMKTGWLTYNNKKYYLNPTTSSSSYGSATTGWVKIATSSGKTYWHYFENDGTMHTGWLTLNGKRYFFNVKSGRMFTGKHTIDGTVYDFGTSGALASSIPAGAWRIEVNRRSCFVVVYKGNTEMRAFVCSTAADGVSTPTGTFTLRDKLRWHELNGPSWGQYCSHITNDILFHSVPNKEYNNNHSLNASYYNQLGSPASGGCIRLTVKHAKYLYDNCPIGTKVIISDSVARPKYVEIETAPKIPLTQNYDPTDPNA